MSPETKDAAFMIHHHRLRIVHLRAAGAGAEKQDVSLAAAGEGETTTRLYGEPPEGSSSAADAAGLPGITVTKAWGWPAKDVLAPADVVVAFIGTGGRWSRERLADLDALLARGGGFVVQERIPLPREPHLLLSREGAREMALYVDFSVYASVGLPRQAGWGGVCRGSSAQIVNILGGGGVVPVLRDTVANALSARIQG